MTIEEELLAVRQENKALREQLGQRDELIPQQQAVLAQPQCSARATGQADGQLGRVTESFARPAGQR
jgi:hypothetical protein